MKNLLKCLYYLIFATVFTSVANATIITETVDAGDRMDTAMVLGAGITQVNGMMHGNEDVDLYKFYVDTTQSYTIYLGNSQFGPDSDNLILFNGLGQGLEGDDAGGAGLDAQIIRMLTVGWYYIGAGPNNIAGFTDDGTKFIYNDQGA